MKITNCHLAMLSLISALFWVSCDSTKNKLGTIDIPYPAPLPDSTALVFLPGIVSTDSIDFGSAFSPDGKSFYFSRKKNNRSAIYVSHHTSNKWEEPLLVFFADINYAEADPAFAPDGKLYFISTRPKNKSDTLMDYDIWFVVPSANGNWSEPENMATINSDSAEYYISFAKNGNLYFSSSRAGGFGEEDIYVSKLVNGQYKIPENLGPSVNTKVSEYDPCISAKEDFIIFASSVRNDGFGKGDLYAAKLNGTKKWKQSRNLGKELNTPTREYCPYITPDEKYFFFSSEGNIKWIGNKALFEAMKNPIGKKSDMGFIQFPKINL